MNDTTDKDGKKPGGTLTLKRPAIEQSRVKQSFSHGRTKTEVVETKRKTFGAPAKPAGSPAADAKAVFQAKPRVSGQETVVQPTQSVRPAPAPAARSGVVLRTLTADEREARERALVGRATIPDLQYEPRRSRVGCASGWCRRAVASGPQCWPTCP